MTRWKGKGRLGTARLLTRRNQFTLDRAPWGNGFHTVDSLRIVDSKDQEPSTYKAARSSWANFQEAWPAVTAQFIVRMDRCNKEYGRTMCCCKNRKP